MRPSDKDLRPWLPARVRARSIKRPEMFAESLFPFLVTAAVLTITPGLDTAMVLQSSTSCGARQGQCTAMGIAIGCLCWGTAAAFGLGTLLKAWPIVFECLRSAGAVYLGWIGARLLFAPRRALAGSAGAAPLRASNADAIRSGFLTNILNPKVGIFYLTLLPQFVSANGGSSDAFGLALAHVLIALSWFLALGTLTGTIGPSSAGPPWSKPLTGRPGSSSSSLRSSFR